jgi:xanthine/uracil permease
MKLSTYLSTLIICSFASIMSSVIFPGSLFTLMFTSFLVGVVVVLLGLVILGTKKGKS